MKSVYLALDFPDWESSNAFLKEHAFSNIPVKVGMELFYREGPAIIERLKAKGHPVFLDLKLHDIPRTVGRAMKNIASLDVDIVTVHAQGGSEMIAEAKEALLAGQGSETKLIAITILTSFSEATFHDQLRYQTSIKDMSSQLAHVAHQGGADGIVCAVHEVSEIKKNRGQHFLAVTPGIRIQPLQIDDQKRIATPSYAKEAGADILVVGRAVTKAAEPYKAYEQIWKEWDECNII
ncbi:orotidine-5'-phosphate decarboxylase [Virgibacillus soli]|uniref:Orotidine 5'-phosphate decarboxylase n=1 Tax=Paracerasibacillus soli TaxID=480284 RepID=A0ABU5CP49_9BACI|nr:orotidine-5'-phosphate decarboxylase [Virgibacillus soli]MDY0408120.1 orotidine-5'-phosphate decarboxylase [Virgibacillus soli]